MKTIGICNGVYKDYKCASLFPTKAIPKAMKLYNRCNKSLPLPHKLITIEKGRDIIIRTWECINCGKLKLVRSKA